MHTKRASQDPSSSKFHAWTHKREILAGSLKIPKSIISPVSKSEKNSPASIKTSRHLDSSPRSRPNAFKISPRSSMESVKPASPKIQNFFKHKPNIESSVLLIKQIPKRLYSPKASLIKLKSNNSERTLPRKPSEINPLAHFYKEKENLVAVIKESFKNNLEEPVTDDRFYTVEKLIGQGAFGKVLLGFSILTGRKVAIKAIDRSHLENEYSRRKIFREVYILKKLKSRFVVKILEVFETDENFLIVMEYVPGGDLLNYLKLHGRMSEDKCKKIFYQVVLGVNTIHKHGILHRDIKLDNILLDKSLNYIKICDFGVSKLVHKGEIITDQCGTPAYLAPEIVLDKGYEGFWSDIWSLGVLLYCMVCGTVPFKANTLQDLHKAILVGKYDLPEFLSANLKHLIRSMLVIVPNRRIPVEKILRHRWFDDCENFFKESCLDETLMVRNESLGTMESFGYPRQHVINSLEFKSLNHSYAVYNMMNLEL